ncbi:hypothetical protein AB8A05_03930 [Tardiphaga sp. 538_B7_N1_4]|uniref:hypothetical protein n=1 Tax=Tardiphaga sp. 538_B7_N1_4 TaxID=3240778 RepID=UPI003F2372CE
MTQEMNARAALLADDDVSMFQGSTTLYRENLKSCAKEGGSTIPSNWSSNQIRNQMEAKGWLTSEAVAQGWSTRWKITDAGRSALTSNEGKTS